MNKYKVKNISRFTAFVAICTIVITALLFAFASAMLNCIEREQAIYTQQNAPYIKALEMRRDRPYDF